MPDAGRARLWGMGAGGQVRLAWPVAVGVAVCFAIAAACTMAGHVGRTTPAQPGGRGADALRSSPGSLVDRPVASSGCRRRPGILPGTTVQLSVTVPPASAAGAGRRSYWLHLPRGYSASILTPLVLAFHGGGGTALGMERTSGLSTEADRGGLLVAYPQGLAQNHGRASRSSRSARPRPV